MKLKGKRAIITGSTKGIGLAIARALVGEGVSVVISSRNQKAINQIVNQLGQASNQQVVGKQCDVSEADQCEILVKTNKGEDFKSLIYIASGGEVSRIMLSIKLSLQEKVNSEVLVFDEVDSGISGSTASKIGNALSDLSHLYQVVCVTHLPQIASKSINNHYKIYKTTHDSRVTSKIEKLDDKNKVTEIARLLSGEKITSDSLKQASNMIGN